MEYKYAVEYRTPSGMPKIPADTIVQVKKSKDADWSDEKYAGGFAWAAVHSFRIVDERYNWHALGELPPVGTECEYKFKNPAYSWTEVVVNYISKQNAILIIKNGGKEVHTDAFKADEFRPLRTDREKFIEAAMRVSDVTRLWDAKEFFGNLFDAGFKAPEATK